ncbi:uncharacterized protein J4E88_007418 [Alternaria novae-zelandiae]|uniref:uncharacterized protein n=1 Tax=Alternaria novae-zelandiae TaxID=430562 RepID=UPI0020C53EBD|nr:uncharacterized protein J4E88_007418 [Alternaria novae-zelandiae]KAI4676500.1 hypothetical protein J4E88_007418 [Alternaria novae-zelandiae]
MTEDNGPHGLRWWAGHIMMANTPVRLLPPVDDFHWYPLDPLEDVEEKSCWKVPLGKGRPQHDSGRVGLPFDSNEAGQAEPLDNLLDQDLGDTLLPRFKGSSYGSSRTRPIAGPLDLVVAGRLKRLCPTCSTTEVKHQCTCTFRKRFLDRWLCIECYLKNEARFDPARTVKTLRTDEQGECPCGNPFDPQNEDSWFACKWCDGRVLGSFEKMDREEQEKSFVPDEEDEDEEGAWPEMLPHGGRSNLDGRLIDQAIEDAGSKAPGLYLHMVCQEVLSRKHLLQMDAYKKKMEEGKDEEFNDAAYSRRRNADLMLAYQRQKKKIEAMAPFSTPDLEAEYSTKYRDLHAKLGGVQERDNIVREAMKMTLGNMTRDEIITWSLRSEAYGSESRYPTGAT